MVVIYTSPGCASCRKAKQWLKDNHIEFVEKNLFTSILDEKEIKYILSRCENGTEDIISVRSKAFQSLEKGIDEYSLSELVTLIQQNPSILKRPIMLSKNSMVVGYDDDEITMMTPVELRSAVEESCTPKCPNYEICGQIRNELPISEPLDTDSLGLQS